LGPNPDETIPDQSEGARFLREVAAYIGNPDVSSESEEDTITIDSFEKGDMRNGLIDEDLLGEGLVELFEERLGPGPGEHVSGSGSACENDSGKAIPFNTQELFMETNS
jgi:hypothetical protein